MSDIWRCPNCKSKDVLWLGDRTTCCEKCGHKDFDDAFIEKKKTLIGRVFWGMYRGQKSHLFRVNYAGYFYPHCDSEWSIEESDIAKTPGMDNKCKKCLKEEQRLNNIRKCSQKRVLKRRKK